MTDTDEAGILLHVEETAEMDRESRKEFHRAIVQASEMGVPMRRIAAAAGISHQRVHQIVRAPSAA